LLPLAPLFGFLRRPLGDGSRWLLARVDGGLSQSVPARVGEVMLIAIPVDVARADQPLELFRL
jgi:hypothetical protein